MMTFNEWQATRQRVTAESNPALFEECHGINLELLMAEEIDALAYHVYDDCFFIGEERTESDPAGLPRYPLFTLGIENMSWEETAEHHPPVDLERRLYNWLKEQDYYNSFAS